MEENEGREHKKKTGPKAHHSNGFPTVVDDLPAYPRPWANTPRSAVCRVSYILCQSCKVSHRPASLPSLHSSATISLKHPAISGYCEAASRFPPTDAALFCSGEGEGISRVRTLRARLEPCSSVIEPVELDLPLTIEHAAHNHPPNLPLTFHYR